MKPFSNSQNNSQINQHEKLFDEICGKLNELSRQEDSMSTTRMAERLEKMQSQIQRSQQDLVLAQQELEEKIRSLDDFNLSGNDYSGEMKKLTDQLDQERLASSRLSADLARSLELNLKLQYEIEEVRSKSNVLLHEEKRQVQQLQEKLTLLQDEKLQLDARVQDLNQSLQDQDVKYEELKANSQTLEQENTELIDTLQKFETHVQDQKTSITQLSSVAEKKIVELKLLVDKKTSESQDYYSHLQQALAQTAVLRQENAALKEYATKLVTLIESQQVNGKSSTASHVPVSSILTESVQTHGNA